MVIAGRQQARAYWEKFRTVEDPEKQKYLINEAYEARDALYRDIMKLDYDPKKGKYIGQVEKRHLKYESGAPVYAPPTTGKGLGQRLNDVEVKKEHSKIKLNRTVAKQPAPEGVVDGTPAV
eukprot:UN04048